MRIRCRGPSGVISLPDIPPTSSLRELRRLIAEATGIPAEHQALKCGFPPLPFPPQTATLWDPALSQLPLADGDTLVVAFEQTPAVASTATAGPHIPVAAAAVPSSTPTAVTLEAMAPVASGGVGLDAYREAGLDLNPSVAMTEEDMLQQALMMSLQEVDGTRPSSMHSGGAVAPVATLPAAAAATGGGPQEVESGTSKRNQGGAAGKPAATAAVPRTPPTPAGAYPTRSYPRVDVPPSSYGGNHGDSRRAAGSSAGIGGGAGGGGSVGGGVGAVRKEIASDNSCLFRAVAFVMEHREERATALRAIVAGAVRGDPFRFNEGVLGKTAAEYADWICRPNSWGGGVELAILSEHYGREIAAYDVVSCRCDLYGQGSGYHERVFLMYDGIHYDALGLSLFEVSPDDALVTVFDVASKGRAGSGMLVDAEVNADQMSDLALALVTEAHRKKQFTDVGRFTLRCGVCRAGVKGQKEAVEHAKATGHGSFEEYR